MLLYTKTYAQTTQVAKYGENAPELALDSPRLDPNDDLATLLKKMDLFFTGLFFCEMSIKIVAFGFVCNGKESYLRSAWNQVDFVIVMISLRIPVHTRKRLSESRSIMNTRSREVVEQAVDA